MVTLALSWKYQISIILTCTPRLCDDMMDRYVAYNLGKLLSFFLIFYLIYEKCISRILKGRFDQKFENSLATNKGSPTKDKEIGGSFMLP